MEKTLEIPLVRVIAVSKPVAPELLDYSLDEYIAYVARVSNPANQANTETSAKLLNYLMKNKHWSPFEMASATLEINTTRDIARQILRHRSFSFQEFSQRYADPTGSLGFSTREARLQDTKNRQNSLKTDDLSLQEQWLTKQTEYIVASTDLYKWAADNGIAKEQARAVLPEGLTNSRLYMAGSLRSWITYMMVRTDNSTQLEHRLVAMECWNVLREHFDVLNKIEFN